MTQETAGDIIGASAPLEIAITYAPPLRVWHRRLADRLGATGHRVRLQPIEAARVRYDVPLLMALEDRLYRARSALFQPVAATDGGDLPRGEMPDLTIVLAGEAPVAGCSLRPYFDGGSGDHALLAALLDSRAPVVTIRGRVDGRERLLATGHPAIEDRHVLAVSLDHVLARVVTLLAQATGRLALEDNAAPPQPASEPAAGSPFRLLVRSFGERLSRKLGPARGRSCGWGIAHRIVNGPGVAETRSWPDSSFVRLACDDARFYADPFALEHEGRRHLFFEDFPYATQKGVIAHVEIDADGTASAPRTVLEAPVHLSYPLLLRHAGVIYMLPETSGARRLQLFRADPFPDRWVADRVLVADAVIADATPIFHEGSWWMFASLNDDGGSTWDQLALYHAPDLLGPWMPHDGNPVLIDAGAARPAGAMWHEDGVLMRVAQDCRQGYGRGLAICRVDRLDCDGFAQTVVARLGAPPGSGAHGAHTLNRDGDLEAIDLNLMPP